jgi:hypothetical protein
VPWVLTFDGQVYREADLTIDEAERMENASNTTWRFINPLRSAKHARVILSTFLVTRGGMSAEEATAKVGALKVTDFLDLYSDEEEDADLPTQFEDGFPQSADGTSTAT